MLTSCSWVKHNLEARKGSLAALMQHVRFSQLPLHYLLEVVCNEPLLRESLECLLLVDEAKTEKLRAVGFALGLPSAAASAFAASSGGGGGGGGSLFAPAAASSGELRSQSRSGVALERSLPRKSYGGALPSRSPSRSPSRT